MTRYPGWFGATLSAYGILPRRRVKWYNKGSILLVITIILNADQQRNPNSLLHLNQTLRYRLLLTNSRNTNRTLLPRPTIVMTACPPVLLVISHSGTSVPLQVKMIVSPVCYPTLTPNFLTVAMIMLVRAIVPMTVTIFWILLTLPRCPSWN